MHSRNTADHHNRTYTRACFPTDFRKLMKKEIQISIALYNGLDFLLFIHKAGASSTIYLLLYAESSYNEPYPVKGKAIMIASFMIAYKAKRALRIRFLSLSILRSFPYPFILPVLLCDDLYPEAGICAIRWLFLCLPSLPCAIINA